MFSGERGPFEMLLRAKSPLEASGSSDHGGFSWVSPVGGAGEVGAWKEEHRVLLAGRVEFPCARSSPCLPAGSPISLAWWCARTPPTKTPTSVVTFPL